LIKSVPSFVHSRADSLNQELLDRGWVRPGAGA